MPEATQTKVFVLSKRRCCFCFVLDDDYREKRGQIAHVDHDPTNNDIENLAYLCPSKRKGTQRTKLNIDSSCLSLSVFWMPRCPRLCPAGTCFHVNNRAVARLTLFEKQEDYVAFERALKLTHERVPLPIYACCRIIGISWFSRKPIRWLLSSFAG